MWIAASFEISNMKCVPDGGGGDLSMISSMVVMKFFGRTVCQYLFVCFYIRMDEGRRSSVTYSDNNKNSGLLVRGRSK